MLKKRLLSLYKVFLKTRSCFEDKGNKPLYTNYLLLTDKGFGLIEILIAVAILSASLITLTATAQISFRIMKDSLERTQASFLAEEGVEVVRILRDTSWLAHIAPHTIEAVYYPVFSTTTTEWTLTATPPSLISNLFTRTVVFYDVYRRDSDSEIVDKNSADQKTLDPDTRQISSRVEWETGSGENITARNVEMDTYITNIFQN